MSKLKEEDKYEALLNRTVTWVDYDEPNWLHIELDHGELMLHIPLDEERKAEVNGEVPH